MFTDSGDEELMTHKKTTELTDQFSIQLCDMR